VLRGHKLHLFDIQLKDDAATATSHQPEQQDSTLPPVKIKGESDRILKGRDIPEIIDFGMGMGGVGLEICYDIR
jgi:hypothetical protein